MSRFLTVLKKDIVVEFRSKTGIALLCSLAIILSAVCAVGVQSAFLEPRVIRKIFPTLLWVVFIFSATVGIGKCYEEEFRHSAAQAVIMTGFPPHLTYLSKFMVNAVLVLFVHCIALLLLSGLTGMQIASIAGPLVLVSIPVILAYSALATLLAALAHWSSLQSLLLPIILLPLLFPVLFAALELTTGVIESGTINQESPWLSLLLFLDLLYFLLGFNLFGLVIRE